MRKLFLTLFTFSFCAISYAQNFSVQQLTADFYLSKEGYFDVVEKYDVKFQEPAHGIYRDFITRFDYKDAKGKVTKRTMYISDIEVPGEQFSTNELLGKQWGDMLRIKIGDKKSRVYGEQHYEIRYRVKNALFFNGDKVSFYWNVKSPEWFSVFFKVNFTVHAPDGAVLSPENCFVYAGPEGDTAISDKFVYNYNGNVFSAQSSDFFVSPYLQSVTALIELPKNLIKEVDFTPPFTERYRWLGILLGVLALGIVAIKLRLKAISVTPVTSYYPPDGVDSALAGALIDDITNPRDIQSLLPYWGSKGYIKMEEIPAGEASLAGDLKLTKLKDLPADSPGYQINIFRKLFIGSDEIYMSSRPGVFGEGVQLLIKKTKEFYKSRGRKIKIIVLILSWIVAFSLITWFPFVAKSYVDINGGKFIAFIIVGYLFFFIVFPILFAFIFNKMRAKTEKGKQILGELYGFRQFIRLAEADRLKVLLEEDPYYFEKTMPYAVSFNLLREWTDKFEGLLHQTPAWYSSTRSGNNFTMHTFASSMNSSMMVAKAGMVSLSSGSGSSSRSSSGGGSSGGGAGRGGGGSW